MRLGAGDAEMFPQLPQPRMGMKLEVGDVEMFPQLPPPRMGMRKGVGDAEMFPQLPPPRMGMRLGVGGVEVPSLRLLSRVLPLPFLSTVELGNVEVPKRKIRLKKLNVREIADCLIL